MRRCWKNSILLSQNWFHYSKGGKKSKLHIADRRLQISTVPEDLTFVGIDHGQGDLFVAKDIAYAESFKFSLGTKSKGGIRHMEDFTREFIASLIGKPLGEIVQVGAQKIVEEAVLADLEIFMCRYTASFLPVRNTQTGDGRGRQGVARNGNHRERAILTAAGESNVKVPRVRDRREGDVEKAQFRSSILPPYLRRASEMDEFVPYLYLKVRQRRKGISTGDFSGVLIQLQGKGFKSDLSV